MSLTCEEAEALLGEYVLNALPPEEQQAAEEHLRDCRNHDAGIAEYRSMAAGLGGSVEEIRPPRRLRGQLLAAFDQEARRAAGTARPGLFNLGPGWWRRLEVAYGIAAVLLIAAIGLGVWNLSLHKAGNEPQISEAVSGPNRLRVIFLPQEKLAVIDYGLTPLAPDRAYQLWQLPEGGGVPVSLGLISGKSPMAIAADLSAADAVAVSIEPAGGSSQPTSAPILVDKLG